MALQDDDVLLVSRGGNNYKITWADLKSEISNLPFTSDPSEEDETISSQPPS